MTELVAQDGRARRHTILIGIGLTTLALVMVGVLLCSILVFPEWIISQDVGGQVKNLTPEQLAKAKNDIRTTLLQAVAGIVLLLGAIAAWRQLRLSRMQLFLTREQAELASKYSNEQLALTREQVRQAQEGTQQELRLAREGQITDRFTRAIDHLGNEELDVRLGGIYALVRIAHDSPPDQQAITEILAAYIRRHSPWPPAPGDQYAATAPIDEIPELRIRAADVQAALSALGRGLSNDDVLDLSDVDLRKADLAGCHLEHAFFSSSHLESSNLTRVHLQRALFLFCDASRRGQQCSGAGPVGGERRGQDVHAPARCAVAAGAWWTWQTTRAATWIRRQRQLLRLRHGKLAVRSSVCAQQADRSGGTVMTSDGRGCTS